MELRDPRDFRLCATPVSIPRRRRLGLDGDLVDDTHKHPKLLFRMLPRNAKKQVWTCKRWRVVIFQPEARKHENAFVRGKLYYDGGRSPQFDRHVYPPTERGSNHRADRETGPMPTNDARKGKNSPRWRLEREARSSRRTSNRHLHRTPRGVRILGCDRPTYTNIQWTDGLFHNRYLRNELPQKLHSLRWVKPFDARGRTLNLARTSMPESPVDARANLGRKKTLPSEAA